MNNINDASAPNDCVIYTRVSSVKQLKEGDGLESQKRSCSEFAKSKGYNAIEVFADVISGSKLDRPGMNAMLKQLNFMKAQNAGSTSVIIDDISRLARDVGTHRAFAARLFWRAVGLNARILNLVRTLTLSWSKAFWRLCQNINEVNFQNKIAIAPLPECRTDFTLFQNQ